VGGAVGEQKANLFVGRDRTGCGELPAYRVAAAADFSASVWSFRG
jgi:hypothetical protein